VPAECEFIRDANGRVTGMVWTQGAKYTTKKIADTPQPDTRIPYNRAEVMIPMRDGVKLFTVILTPPNADKPSAFLLERTPYGVKDFGSNAPNRRRNWRRKIYFVYQDIRGRNDSEGQFIMNRPLRDKRDTKSVDESTDTYDTIDYLIKNA
jgi:predicted acyl esterase